MLKKTSDEPVDYQSDTPQEDFDRFGEAMKKIVKQPTARTTSSVKVPQMSMPSAAKGSNKKQ